VKGKKGDGDLERFRSMSTGSAESVGSVKDWLRERKKRREGEGEEEEQIDISIRSKKTPRSPVADREGDIREGGIAVQKKWNRGARRWRE